MIGRAGRPGREAQALHSNQGDDGGNDDDDGGNDEASVTLVGHLKTW